MTLLRSRGSALITVIMLVAVMAIMTTYLLNYGVSERRMNERQRLVLRSRNMAENVVLYASEQITNKLYKLRSPQPMAFMAENAVTLPPDSVLTTEFSTPSDVDLRAGLTSTSGLIYLDPNDPANATNPNAGLQVSNSTVPIIGKSTMRHSNVGTVTTYAEQNLEVAMMPLFQFAIFYNMDLEFGPGPNMTISGPVHTNGDFISRIQTGFNNTIRFTDRVTSAKGFYANTAHRGPTYMADGAVDNGPGGGGPLIFRKPSESVSGGTEIKASNGVWRDHKWGGSTETASSLSSFRNFATSTYAGNLRTSVHGVTKLVLPAIGDYDESTPEGRRNGRQIIEQPEATDAGGLLGTKFSRNAGLYIVVNPDDEQRTGRLPNGSNITMRPRSYRSFLNADGSYREVVLPGQPSYGALNATINSLPNAYRVDTSVGHNQVLRIPQGGGDDLADTGYAWSGSIPDFDSDPTPAEVLAQDAYFYDLRRGFNNTGYPFNRSSSNRYRPRPIAKIDFDFTRFKMAVERTLLNATSSTIFHPGVPNNTNWANNILNPSASTGSYGLGIATGTNTNFNEFPTSTPVSVIRYSASGNFYPSQINITPWQKTGAGASTAYNGRILIETTSALPDTALSNDYPSWNVVGSFPAADANSATYSPRVGDTAIRISLYTSGSSSADPLRLLSQQIIPVVHDLAPLGVRASDADNDGNPDMSRFIIAETTNSNPSIGSTYTNRYTSASDEQFVSYTPTASNVTAIRVRQYAAGGTSTLVREQYIPVVTALLTNDRFVVPCTSTVSGFLFTNAVTSMRIFVGGVDDTANWTYSMSTSSGGVTGTQGSGPFTNRYTANGISASAGAGIASAPAVVRITASKTGYTSIWRNFTLVKQKSITGAPTDSQTGVWFDTTSSTSVDPFRIYFAPDSPADTPEEVVATDLVGVGTKPWYDGITIYVHSVDAEDRTTTGSGNSTIRNRVDSGVRLWNGRGPIISLPPATYPGRTGLSFATNDAVYIVGHFNADGTVNANLNSTGVGGYSGRYPESASEMLTSVMGDAITILSQPQFTQAGSSPYRYYHNSGWADSMSANRRDDNATYSSSWMSSNPGSGNTQDGLNASIQPALMPNLTVPSSFVGTGPRPRPGDTAPSTRTSKFAPSETEISACLLTGIVPTTKSSSADPKQTSGGAHNFPRLSENWAGTVALYIRGSLVAMFESQVATEPWSIRYYQGAIRNWGLHESLRDANHDVPLEPIVLNARRMSYRELSEQEYNTLKAQIEALPH